jgi:hypothetical protein
MDVFDATARPAMSALAGASRSAERTDFDCGGEQCVSDQTVRGR